MWSRLLPDKQNINGPFGGHFCVYFWRVEIIAFFATRCQALLPKNFLRILLESLSLCSIVPVACSIAGRYAISMTLDETLELNRLAFEYANATHEYRETGDDAALELTGSTMVDLYRFVRGLVDKASQKS